MIQIRAFFSNGRAIHLIAAFLVGLPIGLLATKAGTGIQNVVPFLLFPLLIGVISAFTVNIRQQHPHLLALGTALLAWGGIGVSLLIMTAQAVLTPCTAGMCSSTTARVLPSLLIIYLLLGLILVAIGALISSLLWRSFRRAAQT
jgi:hypothetical protein